jgi:archaetidylserine synthase
MEIRHYIGPADIVSILNASSGFLAIIMAISGNIVLAAKFLLLAVVFDGLDGWVARRTKRQDESGFGINMDSLSDVISFGVAPGIILYVATANYSIPYINILVGLLIVICGILRLSRFNVLTLSDEVESTDKFVGLPIPSTALIMGSFYLSGWYITEASLLIMSVVSLLMISTIRYPKFKDMKVMVLGSVLVITSCLPQGFLSAVSFLPAKLLLVFTLIYVIIVPLMELYAKVLKSGPHVR